MEQASPKQLKIQLLAEMKRLGLNECIVRYEGGGDEGSVQSVEFDGKSQYSTPKEEKHKEADRLAEALAYACLDACGYDLWNNEGGHAELTVNANTGEVEFDAHYYEQSSTHAGTYQP